MNTENQTSKIHNPKPLVSVVMPAYNAEKFIGEAIDSILNQTYPDFELIIVDDASVDGTREVIHHFDDARIQVFANSENKGIAYSTNKAIDASRGKYVALMDDDDISDIRRLEIQVDYLERHEEIDILGGGAEYIDENGMHLRYRAQPFHNPKFIRATLLLACRMFCNGTAMIRKSFLDEHRIRYKDGYYGMQDYQFYVESSKLGTISSVDNIIYKHREHKDNETQKQVQSNAEKRAEAYKRIRRYSLEKSGFMLSDKQYYIIDKVFTELNEHIESQEDLLELIAALRCILEQAHKNNVDNITEIELAVKKKFSEALYKSDIFSVFQSN